MICQWQIIRPECLSPMAKGGGRRGPERFGVPTGSGEPPRVAGAMAPAIAGASIRVGPDRLPPLDAALPDGHLLPRGLPAPRGSRCRRRAPS